MERSILEPFECEILEVSDLSASEKLFKLRLASGGEIGHRPGQFLQVSVFGIGEAPISVCSSPSRGPHFELAARKTGVLTSAMHELDRGDLLSARGPFGSCFDTRLLAGNDLVLIAGGCGLAPLRSLIQYCEDHPNEFGEIHLLYGANSPEKLLFKEDLRTWRSSKILNLMVTVDHAASDSCYDGAIGLITELVESIELSRKETVTVIVGPPVMYKPVIDILREKGLSDYQIMLSLERYMRCGYGKCGHCRIGHLNCCVDGPVFWLNEISRVEDAI